MGLCKCPKKKVTNQFCFEHRVNVCEHCMVTNHPKCVVQSYLQWLQDSDYNPTCDLCQGELAIGECIRLTCYHVFHCDCLNQYASQLPPYTAPDGYTCPTCKICLFPPDNVASPVAEHLRKILSEANWSKSALGIPSSSSSMDLNSMPNDSKAIASDIAAYNTDMMNDTSVNLSSSWTDSGHVSPAPSVESYQKPMIVNVPENKFPEPSRVFSSVLSGPLSAPRKVYDAMDDEFLPNASFDHDENKYKRRSALEWLARWFKSYTRPKGRHDPHRRFKRWAVIAVLFVLGLLTLIMVFNRLGRASADEDPFLDPMANPNIRVGQNNMITD